MDIKHVYMYVYFVFLSSANFHRFPKFKKLFRKKICPAFQDMYFFMRGIHFLADNGMAMKAMSLFTAHVIKTFLHYLLKCLDKKKLLLNKRYHFLRFISFSISYHRITCHFDTKFEILL